MMNMALYDEIVEASGIEFQHKFSELMKEKYGDRYQETCTYGNTGDWAVDGVLNYNVAFAVYAPEIYDNSKAKVKIKSDFQKFYRHYQSGDWSNISLYIFVLKYLRKGVTPDVLNLVSRLSQTFPVLVWTLDDVRKLADSYLPYSDDGRLFEEFKMDFMKIAEYAMNIDFSSQPFDFQYPQIVDSFIRKWSSRACSNFKNKEYEDIKRAVITAFYNLSHYFDNEYVHLVNGYLIFNPDNHDRLINDMQPNVKAIRCQIVEYYNTLFFNNDCN